MGCVGAAITRVDVFPDHVYGCTVTWELPRTRAILFGSSRTVCVYLSRNFCDPVGDAVRGRFDGIVGEVSVTGGGLHLGVAKQLANHRQAFTDQETAAGEAVAQVVDAQVVQPRTRSDAPPRVLQVGQMSVLLAAGDDPRVVTPSLDTAQHGDGRFAEMDDLGSRFRLRQLEFPDHQVDM